MAETHILQHLAGFVLAMWWTKSWLMQRTVARWRFAISGLTGSILWIFVAYTATRALDTSSGVTIAFNSMPLAYFSAFMAFVSVIGTMLGLVLWTEEEARDATEEMPDRIAGDVQGD